MKQYVLTPWKASPEEPAEDEAMKVSDGAADFDIRKHIKIIQQSTFDPRSYQKRGYVLPGSNKTKGCRLMLLAYKLDELQGARFSETALPPRTTSTVAGTNYRLSGTPKVIKSQENAERFYEIFHRQDLDTGIDL
ncbi:hypothetical protein EDD11_008619 [Mortierella claussenii]|nr:hypothetical protein EDD11_008619 [Mortierella claussenii]